MCSARVNAVSVAVPRISAGQGRLPRLTRVALPALDSIGPETRNAQVAVSTTGLIAFSGGFDEQKRAITIIDSRGKFVSRFGAPGRGPGEILPPFQIAFAGADVVMLEVAGRRLSRFTIRGAVIDARPTPGSFYLVRASKDSIDVYDWPTGKGLPVYNYLRIAASTLEGRTIASGQTDAVAAMARRSMKPESTDRSLVPILYFANGANVVVGNPTMYDLEVLDANGRVLHRLTRTADASKPLPADFQMINGLQVDGRSRLWVMSDLGKDGNTVADVFDGKTHVGTIDLGCRATVSIAGRWLAALCQTSDHPARDVELRLFRIED